MSDELEKRIRELEIDTARYGEKYKELDLKFTEYLNTHRQQCPFYLYKDELFEKITEHKAATDKDVVNLKARADQDVITFENKLIDQRNQTWKVLGAFGSIITIVVSFLFTMQADKVSNEQFSKAIEQLSNVSERQIEIYDALRNDVNKLTIDVGIIKAQLEKKDRR